MGGSVSPDRRRMIQPAAATVLDGSLWPPLLGLLISLAVLYALGLLLLWRYARAHPEPVDAHHDQVRFGWELGPQDGPAPIAGPDVAVADPEGRLELVLGFLDRVPAASNTARLTTRAADMRRRLVNHWAG